MRGTTANVTKLSTSGDKSSGYRHPRFDTNMREAIGAERLAFQWHPQRFAPSDNMLLSHGRDPYKSTRKILVSVANAYSTVAATVSAAWTDKPQLTRGEIAMETARGIKC